MNHTDITFEIGSVNPSGISDEVYFIPKKDIAAFPTITDDFATAATETAYASLTGDFTLKSGKVWTRMYNTQGKGKATYESQGETDCKMYTNKLSMLYPKINVKGRALSKAMANGDYVFIFKHDGKYYLIGSKDYRAVCGNNGDTGDAAGSAKGITFNVECPDVTPLPEYSGDIVLSDGTLDCSTDTFTPSGSGSGSGGGGA